MLSLITATILAVNSTLICVADRSKSPSVLGGALSYACSTGDVNCAPINQGGAEFYPNTIYAHCDYAFNQYYVAHESGGSASCSFNGAAYLVNCTTNCVKCVNKPTATNQQLLNTLGYLCGPGVGQLGELCVAIRPGGAAYFPNTTRDHANWAVNTYYQVYRCAQPTTACEFSGTTEVEPCM